MKYIIDKTTLTGISDAIRSKNGSTNKYTPDQMISQIENLGSDLSNFPKSISYISNEEVSSNGMYYSEFYLPAGSKIFFSSLTNDGFFNDKNCEKRNGYLLVINTDYTSFYTSSILDDAGLNIVIV